MVLLKRLLALRFRLSAQLHAAIAVAVALTVVASLIGWSSFGRVGTSLAEVNDTSLPQVEIAYGVTEYSADLGTAAARLTTAANPAELEEVSQQIVAARGELRSLLEDLAEIDSESSRSASTATDALSTHVEAIRRSREAAFGLEQESDKLLDEVVALSSELESVLTRALSGDLPPLALQSDTVKGLQQLSSVFGITDPTLVEAREREFTASMVSIDNRLSSSNDERLKAQLTPLYEEMRTLGLSGDGIFSVMGSRIQLNDEQAALLELSEQETGGLMAVADELLLSAVESTKQASESSSQTMTTGRIWLLGISIIAIIAGLLIGWRFVGRVLLHRIDSLTDKMRHMAAGQLDEGVEVVGRDELAEMAAALEVFRVNSQEALRLDLVETLNRELEGKNTQLESALDDLQTAQDQIVMREKLAALGEVTAGVAHEIRNPLNFVKNFSELSEELLKEMLEEINEGGDNPDLTLIAEVANDLVENLERIRSHGDRANRIVNDMLLMGQSSNNWQPIDLNALLVEHAMLAYHSARALDTEFNLIIEEKLDEEVGDIRAIPQDLGRAFINIVGNACQATDEKRRRLADAGVGFEGYAPTVTLSTKGFKEEVEIRIRDNGLGIPQDIIEKVFNPFFTTKPANQGTGLGLAVTSDIIREHGGSIQLESEPDQYTELLITIPRAPLAEVAPVHAEEAWQGQG